MSLTVTQRPSIVFESETARWNAVKNPILYKMQRKDFTFNQINNSGGFVQLQFNAVDLTTSFEIGDSVYVKSDNGVYDILGTITASSFSTNTLVTINQSYISSAPGGFVNSFTLRPNYRVQVDIYNSDDELLTEYPLFVPVSSKGMITLNVSPILRAYLNHEIGFAIGSDVAEDTNAFVKFYIKYTEVWTDSAESQTDDVVNQFFATLAAMQIPAANGGNIAPYTVPETEFLTKLDNPVMWRGYPMLLSAIISEDVGSDVYLFAEGDMSLPGDYSGKQIAFDLNEIITDQTPSEIDVVIGQETSGGDDISETLTVKIREACDNPVMLIGRNSLGGFIQWMFDVNQEYSFENADGVKSKRLLLYTDDLTLNEWEALQDFITLGEVYKNNIVELTADINKTSTRVNNQVYVIGTDGSLIGVIVQPRMPTTQTQQNRHTFELEIEYPEIFA